MAQIELESGDSRQAARWLALTRPEQTDDRSAMRAAATVLALADEGPQAERLFARADEAFRRSRRIGDLRARLAVDPQDRAAIQEIERLVQPPATGFGDGQPATKPSDLDRQAAPAGSASEAYTRWCAACHGAQGGGDGPAARYLFPRPRDFRREAFRLASTLNAVPTTEDVQAAIRRGMPGTAMRPFENLSEDQQRLLAEEVVRWNREGVREHLVLVLRSEQEEIDEEELDRVVALRTSPGPPVPLPRIGAIDAVAAARGKETYVDLGCAKCHGQNGDGTSDLPLADEQGQPSPARDLIRDPFKGGQSPEAVYLRLRVGMPGTPHPSCLSVPERQLVDVVQFCREIAREPKRTRTNHQRMTEAARRQDVASAGR
jgi:mono/diheme cytochrome c family protein